MSQCYNTYVTKYTSSVREKCQEVFVKTCRIVQRSQAYNHTVRMCKRPLVKDCNTYQAPVCPVWRGLSVNLCSISVTDLQYRLCCSRLRSPPATNSPPSSGLQRPH